MRFRPGDRGSGSPSPERNRARLLGNALLTIGVFCLLLAGLAYVADPSRADQSLPRPVALESPTAAPAATETPVPPAETTVPSGPATTSTPPPAAAPAPAPALAPAEPPVRMVIRSIYVDSKVQEIGTAVQSGQLVWETVPFVVGHYRTSAMPGQKGNAIFAGHVTSQNLGNVFINLWEINIGDEIQIYTKDTVYTYSVSRVRLVLPTDTSVMDPTPEATATLITCAGDWIPSEHQYSRRLIVTAKLKSAGPAKAGG